MPDPVASQLPPEMVEALFAVLDRGEKGGVHFNSLPMKDRLELLAAALSPLVAARDSYTIRAESIACEVRKAVARHAQTLDDRALGHPEYVKRDRDAIDKENGRG